VVSLLAGAGVSVGVTKVYAGAEFPPESRPGWIKAACWIALGSAGLLSALFLIFSGWVVEHLFNGSEQAYWLLGGLIVGTLPIAFAGIGQGKINGSHRDDLYALSIVSGSVLGIAGLWALGRYLGQTGALLGMIWLVVAQALVMNIFGRRIGRTPASNSAAVAPDMRSKARFLLGYGMLSIAAGAIIPIVYIFIRLLIQEYNGDRVFGLWQATLRISEAYNQLPLMLLSVVLFARFASSAAEPLNLAQVRKTYLFMAAMMTGIAGFVYLTRPYWIKIVFTSDFAPMEAFVPWQVAGDALRVLSYVGTTILAARGAVKLCIVGELVQGGLLLATSLILIPNFPVHGAFYAYIVTYGLYLLLTSVALAKYKR
jgi:PST family polysaccharide transporter